MVGCRKSSEIVYFVNVYLGLLAQCVHTYTKKSFKAKKNSSFVPVQVMRNFHYLILKLIVVGVQLGQRWHVSCPVSRFIVRTCLVVLIDHTIQ